MIRPYTAADVDDALDAWYEASVVAHAFLPDDFFPAERVLLAEQFLPNSETFVYEHDGRVVGFLSLHDHEVGGLFVHPDHQGRGIGRALMDHARSLRPYLELEVFEENDLGRAFYAAYGFEPADTTAEPHLGHAQLRLRID